MDTFGTDTCNDFLADVVLENGVGSLFCGELEGVGAECDVEILTLLFKNTA